MSIEVRQVHKQFGNFTALNNINLDIHAGELVALLGPSGCGKTTLLRIIAGLETPDTGHILFNGDDVSRRNGVEVQWSIDEEERQQIPGRDPMRVNGCRCQIALVAHVVDILGLDLLDRSWSALR